MLSSTFKSILVAATFLASPATAQTLGNFDIIYTSLATNFSDTATNEITVDYRIGKGREYQVNLFAKDCVGSITGMTTTTTTNRTDGVTAAHDGLKVMIDLDKSKITSSNIWTVGGSTLEICIRVQLLSEGEVVKEEYDDVCFPMYYPVSMPFSNLSSLFPLSSKRDFDVEFEFTSLFEVTDVAVQGASLTSGNGEATIATYIKACKCDNLNSYECNTDPLSPDSILYVCIKSIDPIVQIAYIYDLRLYQFEANGNVKEHFAVVEFSSVQDEDISSMTIKNVTAHGIATIVPSRFFSYTGSSSIKINGTVETALKETRRRLNDDLAHDASPISRDTTYGRMMQGTEREAPFGFSIQTESIEAIPDVEWSTIHVGSGSTFHVLFAYSIIGAATCFAWASPIW